MPTSASRSKDQTMLIRLPIPKILRIASSVMIRLQSDLKEKTVELSTLLINLHFETFPTDISRSQRCLLQSTVGSRCFCNLRPLRQIQRAEVTHTEWECRPCRSMMTTTISHGYQNSHPLIVQLEKELSQQEVKPELWHMMIPSMEAMVEPTQNLSPVTRTTQDLERPMRGEKNNRLSGEKRECLWSFVTCQESSSPLGSDMLVPSISTVL